MKESLLDKLKQIPVGAHIAVFNKNPATKLWGKIETHYKDIPTHSAIYVGAGEHTILEADKWVQFVGIDKYLKKKNCKVVAQWYTTLTQAEEMSLKDRIYWFKGKKLFYDIAGYAGFFIRLIPGLKKILKPSNRLFFCSELVATIYEGDVKSKYEDIKNWEPIKIVSTKPTPTDVAPIDIYSLMNKLPVCVTLVLKDKGEVIS